MRSPKELTIQPQTEGVRYELGAMYLSNITPGQPHPSPVELYLFIDRISPKANRHFVSTLTAPTEEDAIVLLKEFASRPDVTLVEEETGKVISKDWLDQPQTVGRGQGGK